MTEEERKQILKSLRMKNYYALKFNGLDAHGITHTFVATIDGCNKAEAVKKAKEEMKENGIEIQKINNVASFADQSAAESQANIWIELLKKQEELQ